MRKTEKAFQMLFMGIALIVLSSCQPSLSGEKSSENSDSQYTVSFSGNGGSGTMQSISAKKDSMITLSDNGFTYTGFAFSGWSLSNNGTAQFKAGGSFLMPSHDVLLYAIWNAEAKTPSETDIVNSALAGTTWKASSSGWEYGYHTKTYETHDYTLQFNKDMTGTYYDRFSNTNYVYNIITKKWQVNSSNYNKGVIQYFDYSATSGKTIGLTNFRASKEGSSTQTVQITNYNASSLCIFNRNLTKE